MKILLTIAYDGTNYFGWQIQKGQITVQEEIERGLKALFGKAIEVRGASRTDSKVHALGQRATFSVETTIPMKGLPHALNNHLPKDIRIMRAEQVSANFHPQYSAKSKTYCYKIYNAPIINPIYNNYAWHVKPSLDISAMKSGALALVGEHNFLSFCATGSSAKTFVRNIYSIEIEKSNTGNGNGNENGHQLIEISVTGNGFLYNMVRIIAGTLAYVGYGKISATAMPKILAAQDRTKSGITAPPQGLTLMQVNYGFEYSHKT
ncbi:MAG: tRNA pseudouridine(38-40) synthase TruA [Defluviitaleaceae bacterium]|nr:tRNA pseudouridine(38-40) synthase TruA [Defluviitaleaceae bacterium]